jgi:ribosomal protein L11 methyltransferase
MEWKEYSILTDGICAEAIAGVLHNMGSGGVVVEDLKAAGKFVNRDGGKPESAYPDFINHVVIKAYFLADKQIMNDLNESIKLVENTFGVKCQVLVEDMHSEDWEDTWKEYYHTFKIGERLIIKPSWEDYSPMENELVINIDPGMAFGTGIHASTRFCLIFIDEYVKGGEKIVDAGCGSGILSIAAAKLGAAHILAMDVDDLAVRIAGENVTLNNLDDVIQVQEGDIVEAIKGREVNMVLANITADVVAILIPEAAQVLSAGGYLLGSGIIDSRWPGVKIQLEANGFEIEQVLQDGDWIGVAARKI